jgi:hypothetical protein
MTDVGITCLCDSPAIAGAVMETNAKMIGTGSAIRIVMKRPVFMFVLLILLAASPFVIHRRHSLGESADIYDAWRN